MTRHFEAYLTMYPSGGFSQSFPPGPQGFGDAIEHATTIHGYVLALPMRRDYTDLGPPPAEQPSWPENKANITALPEPENGRALRITSGSKAGRLFVRSNIENKPSGMPSHPVHVGSRWHDVHEDIWLNWTQVQQEVGEANWEISYA